MTRVDAHHHLWPREVISRQPWRPADDTVLRREFELAEFASELDAVGVDGGIVMQSVDALDENERLVAYAAASDRIFGWVGFADLPHSDRAVEDVEALLALRAVPGGDKLVGVRCLVGADPMEWSAQGASRDALHAAASAGLVWDTVPITDAQVDAVATVASGLPELRVVVDHLASPPMSDEGLPSWRGRLERLASNPNVAIKLSVGVAVLQRWTSWNSDALRPYIETALELFGAERSMIASNWPVVLLRASHAEAWRDVADAVGGMDADAVARVEGGTALEWYGIGR